MKTLSNIQKTKIMASGPITSWEIDGETMETVSGFKTVETVSETKMEAELVQAFLLFTKVQNNHSPKESEKVGLKLNIQKAKIMASGSITSREIDWETVETVSDFILGGSKITADGDCSHEIKRCLLLGKKL